MSRGVVVDLFCGAGGASLGFVQAGYTVAGAVDIDEDALETYEQNLCNGDLKEYTGKITFDSPLKGNLNTNDDDHVTFEDIRNEFGLEQGEVDVIAGCPPCQNFSKLRDTTPWPEDEPKDELLQSYVELIREEKPDAVFFENVQGITNKCLNSLHEANQPHHLAVETTLLVDAATNAVLDVHVRTSRKHDTRIAPQVVKRNGQSMAVVAGDKGYDQKLRQFVHDHGIRPLIKHREFTSLHRAWNGRLDSDLYHRRNMYETVNATIKQQFGAFERSRLRWTQFRELVIKGVVHNEDKGWLFRTTSANTRDSERI